MINFQSPTSSMLSIRGSTIDKQKIFWKEKERNFDPQRDLLILIFCPCNFVIFSLSSSQLSAIITVCFIIVNYYKHIYFSQQNKPI